VNKDEQRNPPGDQPCERKSVSRQRLLQFLDCKEAAWKDEDHPEFKCGTAEWVRRLEMEIVANALIPSGC
jgi:hypothetical protein